MREPTAIIQSVKEVDIREINALEVAIIKSEDDTDDKLWQQAAEVVKLLDAGTSQRLLAKGWINGRTGEAYSAMHVNRTASAFRCNVNVTPRPRFRDAYNLIANDKTALLKSSESNEWYTPSKYVETARSVMGGIDLDPASCEIANKAVEAKHIFTKEDDGLSQEWAGRVWLNPPYGGASGSFALKLVEQYKAGSISEAILLVNSNSTDTDWFQPLWDYLLCFTDHRIDFNSPAGVKTSSTHGSVFVYLGKNSEKFNKEFGAYGVIICRCK